MTNLLTKLFLFACFLLLAAQVSVGPPAYIATTWTPSFIGSSTAGTGQTYTTRVGSYEKNGRQVALRFFLTASSLGTAAGNLQISGLPATPTTVSGDRGSCIISFYTVTGLAALNYGLTGMIPDSTSAIALQSNSNTGSTTLTVAQSGNTPTLIGWCNYRTN